MSVKDVFALLCTCKDTSYRDDVNINLAGKKAFKMADIGHSYPPGNICNISVRLLH